MNYDQFPHGLNDKIRDKIKTDYTHTNFANNFLFIPRKHGCTNREKNKKGDPLLLPQQFLDYLNLMLNINIKDAPHFISISISSMKKSYLKTTHHILSAKL